jgi:single-stranded DNA-binding protein
MTQTHTPTRTPKTRRTPAQTLDALLTRIAQEHLFIDTLETRNSDSLDFHDVSVWGVKEALLAAYQAGLAASQKAAQKSA